MKKIRLDIALVEMGLFESRNQAVEAIKRGEILVDERVATKSSLKINDTSLIKLLQQKQYVSRSAWKLKYYLDDYPLSLEGRRAIDIGSSTGGFTQVLLESGVGSVDSVDVGRDQLHPKIRANPKVRVFEQCDIREFESGGSYDLIVSDVSFISLRKILKDIDRLSEKESDIILLFKPQFEVGKEAKRDSRGVVIDNGAIEVAKRCFEEDCYTLGWQLLRTTPSSKRGKEGNLEYIYHFKKGKLENR